LSWIEEKWGFSENPFSINSLTDPKELEKLFVDRETELKELLNGLESRSGKEVYGISGMRGSGKSTVLNKVLEEMKKNKSIVFKVTASGTFTELDFLRKLLTDVCDQIDLKGASKNLQREVVRLRTNLLYNEKRAEEGGSEASIRASIKASLPFIFGSDVGSEIKTVAKKQIEKTLKPYSKATLTREILQFLSFLKKETKARHIIIGIDETDKCRFEEAEKLLDSIKTVFTSEDSHFVIVGTLDFHRNFMQAFAKRAEEATFSSIFEDVIEIPRLDDRKILEIIAKRVDYYSVGGKTRNPFSKESLQVIIGLTEGLPKQLMRLCLIGFLYLGEEGREIAASDLVKYYKIKGYISDLSVTERIYVDAVKSLGEVSAISESLFNELAKKKIKPRSKKQYRVVLENLVAKSYLTKKTIEGEVKYMPSELCKHISLDLVNAISI
jgi:Cdc6-like AAA superfamily ATPase